MADPCRDGSEWRGGRSLRDSGRFVLQIGLWRHKIKNMAEINKYGIGLTGGRI